MSERTARPVSRLLLALAVLAMAAAGCGGEGAATGDEPTSSPVTAEPTAEPATGTAEPTAEPATAAPAGNPTSPSAGDAEDGTTAGYLVEAEPGTLTVDRIEILTGDAAAAARAEDDEPPVDPTVDLPYLRNRNPELRTLPVADDVRVRVIECSGACELAPWSYDELVAGTPLPYGSPDSPFEITVRDGEVVEIAEVYLP